MPGDSKFSSMPVYPSPIKSKLPRVGTTIFTEMSALAAETGAVNLSQGFPDFPTSPELVDLVTRYMKDGANQYAPMQGLLKLREKIAQKSRELYGADFDPGSEITVTAGATQAIFTAVMALVGEGDEVIVFEPAYDCYTPAIKLAGAEPIRIPLEPPGYEYDWTVVSNRINARTRMIIINSPHNPSGTAMSPEDLEQLQKLTSGSDIIVLSDEVYEHILFDGLEHQSVLRYPELAERSIAIFSVGKTYHNTGWKIGYALAPENLMEQFRLVHQFNVFAVNHPVQAALADYMDEKSAYLELNAFYEKKRDRFLDLIQESRFSFTPSAGTYFQLLDYSAISDDPDRDFAHHLTRKHGVASIPMSPFYRDGSDARYLRFCFAKSDETLEMAAEKLCAI